VKLGLEIMICAPIVWKLLAVPSPAEAALCLLLVVAINLVNFADNMDGLAATLTATTAAGVLACVVISWHGFFDLVFEAVVVIGVCAAFMVHNRPPARVHMGDTGSMSLGFVLGILLVTLLVLCLLDGKGPAASVSSIGLLLGLMLLDGVQVIAARALIRRPIMPGDRRHLSHRLLKIVGSKWKALGILWAVHAVFVAGAVLVLWRPEIWALVVAPLAVGGVALVAWLWRVPGDEYPGFTG
jgi:UDP-GlcNAc:undecaprenyl-phosphate GlcNAc-1-phosphate transferase